MRRPLTTITLCRRADVSCVACCRGPRLTEARLTRHLRRQTRLFRCRLSRPALLRHELLARRGLDLLLAVAVLLPGVGPLVRRWARERMCCAFLGFPDGDETRPGCLLHPTRHGGRDERRRAFALIPGMGCGDASYVCEATIACRTKPATMARFDRATAGLGWFAFSRAAERFS